MRLSRSLPLSSTQSTLLSSARRSISGWTSLARTQHCSINTVLPSNRSYEVEWTETA